MRKASKLFHFLSVVLLMLAFDVSAAFAQNRTIKGNVTDANGEPLIGATVNVKGNSTLGTLTDLDGNFSLSIPNQRGVVLVVSYVGYEPKEIDVAGRTVINVSLSDDTQVLSEVVVVGYGQQKKASVVGAITQATGETLQRAAGISDIGSALTGNLPGVVTMASSGMPGEEDPKIIIRGASSCPLTISALNQKSLTKFAYVGPFSMLKYPDSF